MTHLRNIAVQPAVVCSVYKLYTLFGLLIDRYRELGNKTNAASQELIFRFTDNYFIVDTHV